MVLNQFFAVKCAVWYIYIHKYIYICLYSCGYIYIFIYTMYYYVMIWKCMVDMYHTVVYHGAKLICRTFCTAILRFEFRLLKYLNTYDILKESEFVSESEIEREGEREERDRERERYYYIYYIFISKWANIS